MTDPTRFELLDYLISIYSAETCGEDPTTEEAEGDIEVAAYYLASHCHGGQWSNLYGALCQSLYTPGPMTPDLPNEEELTASALYNAGLMWLEQAEVNR